MLEAVVLPLTIGMIAAIAIGGRASFWQDPRSLAVLSITLVVVAWSLWRAFHLSLTATAHEVMVHNTWRMYELAWPDVIHVGLGEIAAAGGIMRPAIAFTLGDGSIVRAQATPAHEHEWRPVMSALQELAPPGVHFVESSSTSPDGWRLRWSKMLRR
jgi:hypothetical protein